MTRRRELNEASTKPTIYSIATELGISASTVSRALNRPHMVRAPMREEILRTAARQGYQLNRAARGLVTGQTDLIGLAVTDITNPFMPPLVRSVDQAARAMDRSVLLLDMAAAGEPDAGALRQLSSQVDGLIVVSPRMPAAQLVEAVQPNPLVVVNQELPGIPSVLCDNTSALQEAASHLRDQGHHHFLVLAGPEGSWAANRRADALREWGEQVAAPVTVTVQGPWEAEFDAGKSAVPDILASAATAIFAFDDFFACGVIAGLAEAGHTVPTDYSVVGCDDVLLARTSTPQLSTVSAPFEALGRAAVQTLIQQMGGENPDGHVLEGVFAPRGTTGAARRPAPGLPLRQIDPREGPL